jgi:outer membrane protein TolC
MNPPASTRLLWTAIATGYLVSLAVAQNPDLQQKVAEVKMAAAANKQALAQYTWVKQVQFASIPGGPRHVSATTINGVSKQLTIAIANSNYQHL